MPPGDQEIRSIIEPYLNKTGGLITALRAVQEAIGHLPEETDAIAADIFNLSRAEVMGVISFYADFHRAPKGRTVIRLCAAEACQAAGGRGLQEQVEGRLALKMGETAPSGNITLETVYCLGLCSAAPAAMVGERLLARADVERVADALNDADGNAARG